jgi:hypothetical protein
MMPGMRICVALAVAAALFACSSSPKNGDDLGAGTGGGGVSGGGGASGTAGVGRCQIAADCRLMSDYCDGCTCRPLAKTDKDPPCAGRQVQCFVDPCSGKTVACESGACVVKPAMPK